MNDRKLSEIGYAYGFKKDGLPIILVTHSEGFGKMLKYITKNNKLNPRAQMLNFAEDANSRMQRRIRVLFAHNPPEAFDNCRRFPTMNPSMECPFPGYCVEVFSFYVCSWLCKLLFYKLRSLIIDQYSFSPPPFLRQRLSTTWPSTWAYG